MTSLLDAPLVYETRRNHALEHATLHILAERFPGRHLAGHSNPTGFLIFGDAPLEEVAKAATDALGRLQAGERNLAIHPGCGTNYLVAGAIGGTLAWLAMIGARNARERTGRLLPAIAMATFGLVLAQPVGPMVQERITTSADLADIAIEGVYALRPGLTRVVTHRRASLAA
jgi:hypothetical protein